MTPLPDYHGQLPCKACDKYLRNDPARWCVEYVERMECPTVIAHRESVAAYLRAMAVAPSDVVTVGCVIACPNGDFPWCRAVVAKRCFPRDVETVVAEIAEDLSVWGGDRIDILAGPGAMSVVPEPIAVGLRIEAADGDNGAWVDLDLPDPKIVAALTGG